MAAATRSPLLMGKATGRRQNGGNGGEGVVEKNNYITWSLLHHKLPAVLYVDALPNLTI